MFQGEVKSDRALWGEEKKKMSRIDEFVTSLVLLYCTYSYVALFTFLSIRSYQRQQHACRSGPGQCSLELYQYAVCTQAVSSTVAPVTINAPVLGGWASVGCNAFVSSWWLHHNGPIWQTGTTTVSSTTSLLYHYYCLFSTAIVLYCCMCGIL